MAGSPQRPPADRSTRDDRLRMRPFLSMLLCGLCLSSCGISTTSTPRIAGAVLTTRLKEDGTAVDSSKVFNTTDTALHCLAVLEDADPGTVVRARWSVIAASSVKPGKVMGESDVRAESARTLLDFALTPKSGLPAGRYRVDLFLNPGRDDPGKAEQQIEFSVASHGPRLANAYLSADPNGKRPRTTFTTASEVIYCQVALVDGVVGAKVTARWIDSQGTEIDRAEIPFRVAYDDLTFSLKPRAASVPGSYQVEIFLGTSETPDTTLAFSVTP